MEREDSTEDFSDWVQYEPGKEQHPDDDWVDCVREGAVLRAASDQPTNKSTTHDFYELDALTGFSAFENGPDEEQFEPAFESFDGLISVLQSTQLVKDLLDTFEDEIPLLVDSSEKLLRLLCCVDACHQPKLMAVISLNFQRNLSPFMTDPNNFTRALNQLDKEPFEAFCSSRAFFTTLFTDKTRQEILRTLDDEHLPWLLYLVTINQEFPTLRASFLNISNLKNAPPYLQKYYRFLTIFGTEHNGLPETLFFSLVDGLDDLLRGGAVMTHEGRARIPSTITDNGMAANVLKLIFCKHHGISRVHQYFFSNADCQTQLSKDINASIYLDLIDLVSKNSTFQYASAISLVRAMLALLLKGDARAYFYLALCDDKSKLCTSLNDGLNAGLFNFRLKNPIEDLRNHHQYNTEIAHEIDGEEKLYYRHEPKSLVSVERGSIHRFHFTGKRDCQMRVGVNQIRGGHATPDQNIKDLIKPASEY